MEALAELVGAIVALLFEVTIHALVFVFLLVMSIFSPQYRTKLRRQWDTSIWQRFAMILGAALYSAALILAMFVWIPMIGRTQADSSAGERRSAFTIRFAKDGVETMNTTKKLDELVGAASKFLKHKLAEQKEKSAGDAAEQPPKAELPR